MGIKIVINDCHNLAKKNKGKCLSKRYAYAKTKYKWLCGKCKYIWEARYDAIKSGQWCPRCAGSLRLSIKDCHIMAKRNNGQCLSKKYTNTHTKYKWMCKNRHIWMASYDNLRIHWCPRCAFDKTMKNTDDCHRLAKNNGGKFLSTKYIANKSKYTWECGAGHKWKTTYSNVQSGRWCPQCFAGKRKTQQLLQEIVEKLLNLKSVSNYKSFNWLKNEHNLEIDIWFPSIKLAIEYDGRQHFEPVAFFGGKLHFEKRKYLDKLKNKLIKKHNDDVRYFIRFNYKEKITKKHVMQRLIKAGIMEEQ